MERRIWFTGDTITKTEPMDLGLTADQVKVRAGDPQTVAAYDGIWVRGERAYDTYVLVNGIEEQYHAPAERICAASFAEHERHGGGHAVT